MRLMSSMVTVVHAALKHRIIIVDDIGRIIRYKAIELSVLQVILNDVLVIQRPADNFYTHVVCGFDIRQEQTLGVPGTEEGGFIVNHVTYAKFTKCLQG